jgi:GT2 family glycosyltransferase
LATLTRAGKAPDVSIVIVSWNTREVLGECLSSIMLPAARSEAYISQEVEVDGLRCEVIVVDNASHDGTPEMVRQRFPSVRLIANDENIGFARANNQAFRVSSSRYLLMLNPDTRIQPGALRTLVEFVDRHPRAGAAGPRIVDSDGSLQTSCYPAPTLARELWRLFHLDEIHPYGCYDMERWDTNRAWAADAILGACMLLPRKAVDEVGPLDEDFFIYSEEIDLCKRLRERGWGVYWIPQAVVMHHGAQSTRQVPTDMFLRLYEAKVLYFRKHHGPVAAALYKLILAMAAMPRILASPICLLERCDRRRQHAVLADRYRRLVKALPAL